MALTKPYFPNLNGARFVAALVVIVHHAEQMKDIHGLENGWQYPVISSLGELGVTFFFVLSGFLITYLLLREKKRNRNDQHKKILYAPHFAHLAALLPDHSPGVFCIPAF